MISPRPLLLLLALAATLALVWRMEPAPEPELVEARPARPRASAPEAPRSEVGQRLTANGPDLFPAYSWRPPRKPEPPPQPLELPPPPPPQAPPLPFRHLGRWQEAGVDTHFLGEGETLRPIRQGETLGSWRLDEIRNGAMTFTYLPLNQQRTLRLAP